MRKKSKRNAVIFSGVVFVFMTLFLLYYTPPDDAMFSQTEKQLLSFSLAGDLSDNGLIDSVYLVDAGDGECLTNNDVIVECDGTESNYYTQSEIETIRDENIESVLIRSLVEIRDDFGNTTLDVVDSEVSLLSFVEQNDRINRPIGDGRFDYWLRLDFEKPKQSIQVDGEIEVVSDRDGLITTLNIDGEGRTNSDNEITLRLDTSSGTFRKNIADLIPESGKTTITINLNKINIVADGLTFAVSEPTKLYSSVFNSGGARTIIESDDGVFTKVWATDQKLIIKSAFGTAKFYDKRDSCSWKCESRSKGYGAELGLMSVTDKATGNIIASSSGHKVTCDPLNLPFSGCWKNESQTGNAIDMYLQRNHEYLIQIDYKIGIVSGSSSFELNTPETQKDYVFVCKHNQLINEYYNPDSIYWYDLREPSYDRLDCNFPPNNPISIDLS